MITTFAELKTAISGELLRASDAAFVAEVPRFIQDAEAEMKRRLRPQAIKARYTASISTAHVGLPDDFGGFDRLKVTGSPDVVLTKTSLHEKPLNETGKPRKYAIEGNELQTFPAPDTTYTLEGVYWVKPTALSDSNTSNWILANHHDAYFNGALIFAHEWVRDYPASDRRAMRFERIIEQIEAESNQIIMSGGVVLAEFDKGLTRNAVESIVTG